MHQYNSLLPKTGASSAAQVTTSALPMKGCSAECFSVITPQVNHCFLNKVPLLEPWIESEPACHGNVVQIPASHWSLLPPHCFKNSSLLRVTNSCIFWMAEDGMGNSFAADFFFFLIWAHISEERPINLPCLEKRHTFHSTIGNKTGDTTRWHNGVLHTHLPFSPNQRTH